MATNDDVYDGYFIPKGSIILGNAWCVTCPLSQSQWFYRLKISRAILHDERVFKEPEEYCPERYLKDGQLDLSLRQPEVSAFGFGRRYYLPVIVQ